MATWQGGYVVSGCVDDALVAVVFLVVQRARGGCTALLAVVEGVDGVFGRSMDGRKDLESR